MSVPALSGPAPQTPGTPQKTITQLLTQWADLTNAAIAATGDTEGWKDGTPLAKSKPWDPAAENVGLAPCGTVGSKDAYQVDATVFHAAFEPDPHPIADTLTAYWGSQGFTVTRTVDWTDPATGEMDISIRATRPDGIYYGLGATHDIVAIHVSTECSTHPSIDDWAEEGMQERLDQLPTYTPSPSRSSPGQGRADTENQTTAIAITDPSNLFREFHENTTPLDSTELFREFHDDADDTEPETPADTSDLSRPVHDDAGSDSPLPTAKRTRDDYNWRW